jgi:uncharacterized integral membrane protein
MKIIDKFKKQPAIIKVLDVLFIVVLIYEILTMHVLAISWAILFLILAIPFCQWFFKKEE